MLGGVGPKLRERTELVTRQQGIVARQEGMVIM